MSKFVKYKLKDGRQIRGRYDYDTDKVLISREDLEGLLNESDVAYEQAKQLQTIIENLEEIRAEAVRKVLDKIKDEFIAIYPKNYMGGLELGGASCEFSLCRVFKIIDKYRTKSEEAYAESNN